MSLALSYGSAPDAIPLLSRFDGVRSTGQDKWQVKCPSHDDNNASLSVSRGDDGKIVMHCHAGCATRDVLGAVGATMADLFPNGKRVRTSAV